MGFLRALFRTNRLAAEAPTVVPLPYHRKSLAEHLDPEGPKRILALDGGGVRGAMEIAILQRIEDLLRARHGNHPDFRLADYFDLIGGTSTGSIIAAGLAAKRMTVSEIWDLYQEMAGKVFKRRFLARGAIRARFDAGNLHRQLDNVFGELELGSQEFATGFAAVAKRIDTVSPWVLHNNPRSPYFEDPEHGGYLGNRRYRLTQIVRASAAAPMYFDPERIEIGPGQFGEFIDGGLTPHNNPAFQLLMLAGLKNHSYGWTLNARNLLMISIGTGSLIDKTPKRPGLLSGTSAARALNALTSMISSSEAFIELLMQWASNAPDPLVLNSEIGDLREDLIADKPLLSYQRYQSQLTRAYLVSELGFGFSDRDIKTLRDMTDPKAMPLAHAVGAAMARRYVRDTHFPVSFDLNVEANR